MTVTFVVKTQHAEGGARIVCSGELDICTAGRLSRAVRTALDARPTSLHLDCSEVSFMAAAGIDVLMQTLQECRSYGVVFSVTLSPQVRRVLDVVGLWWYGTIENGLSIDTALEQARHSYRRLYPDGCLGARPARKPVDAGGEVTV